MATAAASGEIVRDAPAAAWWRERLWPYALGAGVLLSSFLNFLHYHQYPLASFEAVVAILGLLALSAVMGEFYVRQPRWGRAFLLGLLAMIAVDLNADRPLLAFAAGLVAALAGYRRAAELTRFVAIASLVVLATTFTGLGRARPFIEVREGEAAGAAADQRLPPIVHLILDEHSGLKGLEAVDRAAPGTRQELSDAYTSRGFRLWDAAYSRHFHTVNSIPEILVLNSRSGRRSYIQRLADRGYKVRILRSSFADICANQPYARCTTYWYARMGKPEAMRLPRGDRLELLAGNFVLLSGAAQWVLDGVDGLLELAGRRGADVRPLKLEQKLKLTPVNARGAMAHLSAELARPQRGTAYVAHILLPHAPYVYDPACRLKRLDRWAVRSAGPMPARRKSYAEQAGCVTSLVGGLIDRVRATDAGRDAIFIVHGDHGSRVMDSLPDASRAGAISKEDYAAGFSTLFAVASGEGPGRVVKVQAPVSGLLESFVNNDARGLGEGRTPADRSIFLADQLWHPSRQATLPQWEEQAQTDRP